ncbi:MAG: hypothetical protein AB8F34_14565 [Akkermansiaceae bacterium]
MYEREQSKRLGYGVFLLVLLYPTIASANMGTPLMWSSGFHLLFGNALIGIIEGRILGRRYLKGYLKPATVMVIANYVSAWLGYFFLIRWLSNHNDLTIENLRMSMLGLFFLAFLITLIIEYPFVWWMLNKTKASWVKIAKATLLVNIVTYTMMFLWYWMLSGTSMITRLDHVPLVEARPPAGYDLYYIDPAGKRVLCFDMATGKERQVAEIDVSVKSSRLIYKPNSGMLDLQLWTAPKDRTSEVDTKLLKSGIATEPLTHQEESSEEHKNPVRVTWFNIGKAKCLAHDSEWEFTTGFWPVQGISGKMKGRDEKRVRYALATPFVSWAARSAHHLDGELVVFQLGDDQICLLDPIQENITLLARGGALLVVEKIK